MHTYTTVLLSLYSKQWANPVCLLKITAILKRLMTRIIQMWDTKRFTENGQSRSTALWALFEGERWWLTYLVSKILYSIGHFLWCLNYCIPVCSNHPKTNILSCTLLYCWSCRISFHGALIWSNWNIWWLQDTLTSVTTVHYTCTCITRHYAYSLNEKYR